MTWNRSALGTQSQQRTPLGERLGRDKEREPRLGAILKVDDALLARAIGQALAAGAGLQFSATRDGGAVGVKFYLDSVCFPGYATSASELEDLLEDVIDRSEAKQAGGGPRALPIALKR